LTELNNVGMNQELLPPVHEILTLENKESLRFQYAVRLDRCLLIGFPKVMERVECSVFISDVSLFSSSGKEWWIENDAFK